MDSITFTREELKNFSQVVKKISEFLDTKPEEKPWPQPEDIVWVSNPQDPDGTFHILYELCSEHMKTQGRIFKTRDEAMQHALKWHYCMLYYRLSKEAWRECASDGCTYWAYFNRNVVDINYVRGTYATPNGVAFFPTRESCQHAINIIGEKNFAKYILGVYS